MLLSTVSECNLFSERSLIGWLAQNMWLFNPAMQPSCGSAEQPAKTSEYNSGVCYVNPLYTLNASIHSCLHKHLPEHICSYNKVLTAPNPHCRWIFIFPSMMWTGKLRRVTVSSLLRLSGRVQLCLSFHVPKWQQVTWVKAPLRVTLAQNVAIHVLLSIL